MAGKGAITPGIWDRRNGVQRLCLRRSKPDQPMSAAGQYLPKSDVRVMSVHQPITDSCRTSRQFAFGPFPDQVHRSKTDRYSITSSASDSKLSESFSPSALAVLRLIAISNLVGCNTGISAGFAPLRTLPT
jgi:hypothetical protein